MARYDRNDVVENVEHSLSQGDAPRKQRSVLEKLQAGSLAKLRELQVIDAIPRGTSLGGLKRVLARILRLVTARQSSYNTHNIEALSALAREVDDLRTRVKATEEGPAAAFGLVEYETSDFARFATAITHSLKETRRNLGRMGSGLDDTSKALGLLTENLSAVSARLQSLAIGQQTVYTEVAASRADAGKLWTELGLVYDTIDKRAEDIWDGLDDRDRQISTNVNAARSLHTEVAGLQTALKEIRARLLVLGEQLTMQQDALATMESVPARPTKAGLPGEARGAEAVYTPAPQSKALELAYIRFQREHRADEPELRRRQTRYVELIEKHLAPEVETPQILDLACGDGVFVQLLRERGWDAGGVDLNDAMVKLAQKNQLPVKRADAMEYLSKAGEASLDVIASLQFVEHLPPEKLMELLRSARRVLRPGGLLLLETINPHTLKALHWFHFDLTHNRLIFPEMLQLLCETAGMRPIEWQGINPVPDEDRLSEGDDPNLQKLNRTLFGDQDYYLLARKPEVVSQV